ncbi:MAG TPA: DUF2116 family Zn-ribbon domain-containing protein [Candidatus Thermoplasmatota archaeon]|nr:DUF2116 family Zn-ribbon domain-containing protein [Candidatus Thermoplasmatota archaeon]
MPVQIVNHAHCWICGKAMDWDADAKTCSAACKKVLDTRNKKRRNYMLLLYGLMAASVVYLLLSVGRVM